MDLDPNTASMVSIGLLALSEIIGISRLKENSIIQFVLGFLMARYPRR